MPPPASIVIPTRARPTYLEVALASIVPQADAVGAEVLVIDDAEPSPATRALVERLGAHYEPHSGPHGLNVARNTGVARSTGELVVFVDDDIRARTGWLDALLAAARAHPDVDVFTGPIEPRLEGSTLRSCGREGPPVTSLDLGAQDTDTRYAWGANMTIRRAALQRVGPFEVALEQAGDEQEWQERLRALTPDARVLYVAGAALEHRRAGADAQLRSLARAAYSRGRASRRFDSFTADAGRRTGERTGGRADGRTDGQVSRRTDGRVSERAGGRTDGRVPSPSRELITLAGCIGHVLRRRCPAGLVMVAHSAGRLRESLHRQTVTADPHDDFLSGASGTVGGLDARRRAVQDEAVNAWELISGRRLRLSLAARHAPPARKVLVLTIERPEHRALAEGIRDELLGSRHEVQLHTGPPGELGKFENLNRMLAAHPAEDHDWLLLVDDDVLLPRGFLDRFLFLAERFSLDLAQPAHRLNSHAAWLITRRRPFSVVRETPFVEIGPVTAFARRTFSTLLPFPQLRMGWGLDAHWAALARERHWRCGVLDAVSIRHQVAPAASTYSREAAITEARAFLAERPYLPAKELQRTLTTHRRW